MSSLKDAALRYAAHGWPVFRLSPGSKKPVKDTNGVHEATTDAAVIEAWWDETPTANIGLACGSPSGVVVVDLDTADAGAGMDLPQTVRVRTRKGAHLYYEYTGDLRNSVRKLGDGVDTRADGGYVVLPPSSVAGHVYTRDTNVSEMAPLPQWIVDALTAPPEQRQLPEPEVEGFSPWGKAVLEGEIARIIRDAREDEHNRNDTVFRAAANVYGPVKTGHIPEEEATRQLRQAALSTGLPVDEVTATLESALVKAEPREPAPREERPAAPAAPQWTPPTQPATTEARSRLLTLDDLENLPDPEWLIPFALPEGMTWVYGDPGLGKTFVALDWTLSLSSSGKHIFYALGEGVAGLRARAKAWVTEHPHAKPWQTFRLLANEAFPRLLDPVSVQNLIHDIENADAIPDLLVVDTLARTLGGMASDSSDEAIGRVIAVLDHLRSRFGLSTLVIHHPKKPSKGEGKPGMRGSGAIQGAADCIWKIEDWSGERVLLNEKIKDADELPRLKFRLKPVANSVVVSPSAVELMSGV